MKFEPEEMKAGYLFVRLIRFLGYAILIGGTAGAVFMTGFDIYTAYGLRTQGDAKRAEMEQQILKLTQEIGPAVRLAEQESIEEVLLQTENYTDTMPPYKKALIIAASEVEKLTPVPAALQEAMEIPSSIPATTEEALSIQEHIANAEQHSGEFKKLIYQKVNEGFTRLLSPLREQYADLSRELEKHKNAIKEAEEESWRIKNSEKDPSIFTHTYTEDGHTDPQPNVYGATTEEQTKPFQLQVTEKLDQGSRALPYLAPTSQPISLSPQESDLSLSHSGSENGDSLLFGSDGGDRRASNDREMLTNSIHSLREWFPRWIDGETTTVTDRIEGIQLTDEQHRRLEELARIIKEEKAEVRRINSRMEPLKDKISKIEHSRTLVIDETISSTTKGWVLDSCMEQLSTAMNHLVQAMKDKDNQTREKRVREEYEAKIAGLHNEITVSAKKDALMSNIFMTTQAPIIAAMLFGGWLGCFLIQVLADFMVSLLVLALRVQFDDELRQRASKE